MIVIQHIIFTNMSYFSGAAHLRAHS